MDMSTRAMEGDLSRLKAITRHENDKGTRQDIQNTFTEYMSLYDESKGGSVEVRKSKYTTMVNQFYDLATDFYEFGWGQSFHFAPRHKWESFESSIARHEYWLGHKLNLHKGGRALDVGCGVGGPMRAIARFTEANIVGLNNNAYQIERGKKLNQEAGLSHLCSFMKADFMKVPSEDNTFDAVYQVEATCHAPDKVGIYKEIFRLLKPGAMFGGYEWIITHRYQDSNPDHVRMKKGIEVGNGLPELETADHILACLKEAGFEIIEHTDLADTGDIPWYYPLAPSFSVTGFLHTNLGRYMTGKFCQLLELVRLSPPGAYATNVMLQQTAHDLVEAGRHKIFSPMYFVLVRKPL
eukprot:TRINITY_DN531_c0_g1_i1.p1 TRINITY_DN531_c0_g1~~TRINITY_DN531_c0_g1_i1.p1  ORF type:complete len:372 (-),score=118.37 TRINITY_DN531_c0_g1_i1:53-1108(-)